MKVKTENMPKKHFVELGDYERGLDVVQVALKHKALDIKSIKAVKENYVFYRESNLNFNGNFYDNILKGCDQVLYDFLNDLEMEGLHSDEFYRGFIHGIVELPNRR